MKEGKMGTISNALEKYKDEQVVNIAPLCRRRPSSDNQPQKTSATDKKHGQMHCNHRLVVITAPDSVEAENFRLLRTQVLFAKDSVKPRTIMVTSAFSGEGKTLVAANFAASIALGIEEYVLAVDCDLRRPSMHEMFGYRNTAGLHEHLSQGKALEDLIIRTNVDKLSILTAGNVPSNPTELIASNIMGEFIEEVKGRYSDRFVVIDSPPGLGVAETNALARHVDGIILVVAAHKTPRKPIQKIVADLGREKILGIVFNGYTAPDDNSRDYYPKH
jgi:exopolysaccharide/PEP-CTERM locus tyrosine autokinase